MGDDTSTPKVNTDIPFLFYDVIARVVPGVYLLASTVMIWGASVILYRIHQLLRAVILGTVSAGALASLIGIVILAFWGLASFIGFLLSSPSYLVVERFLFRGYRLSLDGLKQFLGSGDQAVLMDLFKKQFGFAIPSGGKELNRASFLCAYTVWRKAPGLGSMSGRFDTDLMACQSSFLVTILLSAELLMRELWLGLTSYDWILWIVLGGLLLGCLSTFPYLREKRVYGRFALYLSLNDPPSSEIAKSGAP